jgi:hypothetical protein
MWSSHSKLAMNLNQRISDGITDKKNITSLQAFTTTMQYRWEREENVDTPTAWAYWNSTERDANEKQKEGQNFPSTNYLRLPLAGRRVKSSQVTNHQ